MPGRHHVPRHTGAEFPLKSLDEGVGNGQGALREVWGLGFGVWGLGFGVWVLDIRVDSLQIEVWGSDF